MLFNAFMYKINIENIMKMITNADENIHNANILYNEGEFFAVSVTMEILFGENNYIVISRINKKLKGDDMRIEKIGAYRFIGFNSDGSGSPYLHKKILEAELFIKLETVIDIIQNYEKIYSFVESLEDIDSEKYAKYIKAASYGINGMYVDSDWPWHTHDFNFKIFELRKKKCIIFRKTYGENNMIMYVDTDGEIII